MKKYQVTIKFIEEYNIEIQAESEKEAENKALDEIEAEYPSDTYLCEILTNEVQND